MKHILACLTLALAATLAFPVLADDHSTMRVVSVQTDDVAAYVEQLKVGKKLIQAQDENWDISVFQATFAGPNTGNVVVAVSYPGGLAAFASAWEKNLADDEISAWLTGLSGMRTIVADSLYSEMPLD